MKLSDTFPSFAKHWAGQLGAKQNTLERLHGGINNDVFRCCDGTHKWVIKGYRAVQSGQRDGMTAEVQFLNYTSQVAPSFTPALIHIDPDRRCIILENLDGESYNEVRVPTAKDVEAAACFIRLLNRDQQLGRELILQDAAEGFLSLSLHLANLQDRIQAMSYKHVPSQYRDEARDLIANICTEMLQVRTCTKNSIKQGLISDSIDSNERCISPSDFGFHNAIICSSGIKFIDFEFSGWDDPAKTTVDFMFQPRIPVSNFVSPLLSAWPQECQSSIDNRCRHMAPIIRLKWTCIILNVLNPIRLQHMLSSMPGKSVYDIFQHRLEAARRSLTRSLRILP